MSVRGQADRLKAAVSQSPGNRTPRVARLDTEPAPGQLAILDAKGQPGALCPLKHTSVDAEVAGFGARVNVVQTFENKSTTPIEAIYAFPLPADAAVDRMQIKVGSHVIDGIIKRREEARQIYEAAKNAGQTAGLLDQERPNIFTQSVANIMPGAQVQVNISYVQVLKYEGGQFEFSFPMVVGPRYLGAAPDPDKIAPPVTPEGTRTGSTIDLNVRVDAGAPIRGIFSVLHQVSIDRPDEQHALVSLQKRDEIPNRDFVLRYQTASDSVQSAFLSSFDPINGGFFDLILLPPKAPRATDVAPREMIFVMDQSGSQSGFPIEKSKELTFKLLQTMNDGDTFNVYGFNTVVQSLWPRPQPYNPVTLAQAHRFLDQMVANGGTNLLEGLRAALTVPKDPRRLRVVLFNTDGFVGDEPDILREIKQDRDQTRIFTFGIGNSVNHYLIDAMSLEGRGDSETVTLRESADAAVDRFAQRLRSPILTDIKESCSGVELTDVVPSQIPDVFSDRPIVIQGRYSAAGNGSITVTGRLGGQPWRQTLNLHFAAEPGDACVSTLWARKKVDDLKDQSYAQMYVPDSSRPENFKSKITDVALQFGIMTEYTSFVAVEPRVVNVGGVARTVHVPVEMADGISYNGVFRGSGDPHPMGRLMPTAASAAAPMMARSRGFGGGFGGRSALGASADKLTATKSAGVGGYGGFLPGDQAPAEVPRYESIVDSRLRSLSGKVAVMISLANANAATIERLKKLGFSVDEVDKKIGIVFGTCDVALLKKLADMPEVRRVSPVE